MVLLQLNKIMGMTAFITYYSQKASVHSVLDNQRVYLNNGKWTTYSMENVCPLIYQWKTSILAFDRNNQSKILQQIREIRFMNLSEIYLYKNNIESIEGFNRIWMPTLFLCSLDENLIHMITDLKKCRWYSLTIIFIRDNKIKQIKHLQSMLFTAVNKFFLEDETDDECCDIRVFGKAQIRKKSAVVSLQNDKRVRKKEVQKSLRRKNEFFLL